MTELDLSPLGADPLGADYNPVAYWGIAGEIYEEWFSPEGYEIQEAALATVLRHLPFKTVLDVGCGFGRLGELLHRIRPGVTYTGIDVSPHQIAALERRIPGSEVCVTPILDFSPPPERRWDLVITAEVLMHQPAELIGPTVQRMLGWSSGWIVSCDWFEPDFPEQQNAWNVAHDYPGLYGDHLAKMIRVDRQAIFVAKADNPGEEE